MSFRQDLALLLAPDLRDVVRRVEEVDRALEVSIRNLAQLKPRTATLDLVKDDLIESRWRLGEVVGLLTGRTPNRG